MRELWFITMGRDSSLHSERLFIGILLKSLPVFGVKFISCLPCQSFIPYPASLFELRRGYNQATLDYKKKPPPIDEGDHA